MSYTQITLKSMPELIYDPVIDAGIDPHHRRRRDGSARIYVQLTSRNGSEVMTWLDLEEAQEFRAVLDEAIRQSVAPPTDEDRARSAEFLRSLKEIK